MSTRRTRISKTKTTMKRPVRNRKGPPVIDEMSFDVKGMQDLPDELLLQIFSYLPHEEVVKLVPRVCRRWSKLHQDPSLYRKLTFFDSTCTLCAMKMLRKAPWLKTLCLIDRLDTSKLLGQVALSQKRIKRLVVQGCSNDFARDYITFAVQKKILKRCKLLECLKVKHSWFRKDFFDGIGVAFPHLRNIQFDSTKISDTDAIRGIIKNCKQLEELRAFAVFDDPIYGRTTNEDIATLSENASSTLKVLKLNGDQWTGVAIQSLAKCENLKRLHIYHMNKISENGILNLLKLKNLQYLALVRCSTMSSQAWVTLFGNDSMTLMKSISLALCSNVTDQVVQTIGKRLRELQKIRLIGCTSVTEVGFLDLITGCSKLTFLNAYMMNPVVSKVFPLIPTHLPKLRTLIYDRLPDNSELNNLLDQVFEQLPKLTFRYGNTCWRTYAS